MDASNAHVIATSTYGMAVLFGAAMAAFAFVRIKELMTRGGRAASGGAGRYQPVSGNDDESDGQQGLELGKRGGSGSGSGGDDEFEDADDGGGGGGAAGDSGPDSDDGGDADADADTDAAADAARAAKPVTSAAPDNAVKKQAADTGKFTKRMIQPLECTAADLRALARDLTELGALLLYVWLCENRPPHPHQPRSLGMTFFWACAVVFFACSVFNPWVWKKNKGGDTSILGRDQTEEWKGWMQYLFLAYHYFHASSIYNQIRVYVSCYVWMTGFGNFSFFYLKRDFGFVRLWQMMWRLNFLVACLCLTLGNTYILYYICPLHTFYFLSVYCVTGLGSRFNHTEWGMRLKLLAWGCVVFFVWDIPGTFNAVFGLVLGQGPEVGAKYGPLREWHYRSALDHWSTYVGMLFAMNYPRVALWLKRVEGLQHGPQWAVKGAIGAALFAAGLYWGRTVYALPKREYNDVHCYFFFVPMLAYIYLRNASKWARGWHSAFLAGMGKITLETYLMQHHVWLTSNAKTVLTWFPGSPKLNAVAVTVVYVFVSNRLFRLTIALRARLIPDGTRDALRYVAVMALAVGACFAGGGVLARAGAGWLPLACACAAFGAAALHMARACLAWKAAQARLGPRADCGHPLVAHAILAIGGALAVTWVACHIMGAARGGGIASGMPVFATPANYPLPNQNACGHGTGISCNPRDGLWVVLVAAVVLVTGDSFLGVARAVTAAAKAALPQAAFRPAPGTDEAVAAGTDGVVAVWPKFAEAYDNFPTPGAKARMLARPPPPCCCGEVWPAAARGPPARHDTTVRDAAAAAAANNA